MKKIVNNSILFIFLFGLPILLSAQNDLPEEPESWVSDYTNLLTAEQKRILDGKLNRLEKATSTQIFLAIFDRIPDNYYLEDFAVELYEKWQPGRKNENNGVLIVMFSGDRKIKIEVGYGLEGVLTDLQAGRVIDEVIIPEFKKGDYFSGLNKGIDVIIAAVKGEYTIPIKSKSRSKTNWFTLAIIFFVIISILRRFGGRGTTISRKGSRYSRTAWGAPFFFGGGSGGSSFGGGGGFSGGFGGLSGGGGASGSW